MSSIIYDKGHCSYCGDDDVTVMELTDGEYDPCICKRCLISMAEEIDEYDEKEKE